MAKYLQYMLYATVCIVTLLVALLCMWWFMETPYTKEDFLVPAPFMVMVGLATDGRVYYADVDATLAPKWVYTRIGGVVSDIAGSYGKLYTITNAVNGGAQVNYGPYDSSSQTTFTSLQKVSKLSVDTDGKVAGVQIEQVRPTGQARTGNVYTFASPTAPEVGIGWTTYSTDISISGGTWFGTKWPGNLLYKNDANDGEAVEVTIPGVAAGNVAQVSYDGAVCIIEKDGTLWCADSNVQNARANWKKQGTRQFSQISLKGGRIVGVGKDGNIYLSNTYSNPTWTMLPRKEYDAAGVLVPGKPDISFTKVILMYPSLDARRKRYRGAAAECNPDEQKIGAFCYQPCASGRAPVGPSCPYRRLHTPAQASCAQGYDFVDGSCYAPCPTGYTANGQLCMGATTDKGGANATAMAPVSAARYDCNPSGAISARYVRIRPTTLVTDNKLCLSGVTVTGASGQVFSLPSRDLSSQPSTIGRMVGKNIRGAIPILAVKSVGNLQIYVAQDSDGDGHLKMIANDAARTSKHVPFSVGRLSSWRDSYWLNGTAVGTQATGEYMLVLAGQPATTYATDGTCSDNPLGAKTTADGAQYCATLFSAFRSSAKYDGENDQGASSRLSKVYWEVDLGGIQEIKTIQITGCANDPSIKGMQVELLYNSRLPSTTPLVTRKLGPEAVQTLSFNYSTRAPGVDNRCYDTCPPINGLATADGGDMTCVSAPDGITSRSVTTPLSLPDPVCTVAKNEDGTPFGIPKTGGVIADWVIDPGNPTQALSCAGFGVLTPLNRNFIYPRTTETISVDLVNETGTPYTNPNTPYMCVKYDDTACSTGFSYDSKIQMCTSDETTTKTTYNSHRTLCNGTTLICPEYQDDTVPLTVLNVNCDADKYNDGCFFALGNNPKINLGIRPTSVVIVPNSCGGDNSKKCGGDCKYCAYNFTYKKVLEFPGQKNLYAVPKVPQNKVEKPLSRPADCKCLNGDGSINTTAYIYKNKCVQCSGPKDIFYPTGAKSTSSKWSTEKPASWMSLYYFVDGYPVAQVDPANHQYSELQDAKAGCEANVRCTGVTRTYNSRGVPYYSLRAGAPMSTADEAGGSKGSKGSFIDRTNVTPGDSSWERKEEANGRKQALESLHAGFEYSDRDIPRSFADDYVATFPKALPPTSARQGSSSSFDLVNIMSAAVLQMQNTWSSFQNSVQRNTYYVQEGIERHLTPDKVSPENGICVGPCPGTHEFHDQIQMLYSSAASSRTYGSPAYILYGTTCHSNTFTRFPRPSIPANYTPQSGTACASTHTQSGSSCIKLCDGNSIDNGTTCTGKPMQRTFVLPTYTCPSRLKLIDNVCLHDCGPGFTSDGDYCQPTTTISDMPSSINCTRTDYSFTTAGVPGKVNKWLCDSMDDLSALLIDPNSDGGVTGVNSYTQPDDIVCYADDPTTKMYYCTSIPDFVKLVEDTQRTDLSTSCDTLMKSYFDLSDNLSILMGAQMSANTVIGQVNAIKATLETVITTFCETKTDDSGVATCSTLTRLLGLLDSTENSGSGGPFAAIAIPVQVGVQSRDTLIGMLSRYKCCSLQPEGTTYPWCDVVPG